MQEKRCTHLKWTPATFVCIARMSAMLFLLSGKRNSSSLRGAIRGGIVHARDNRADAATWRQERERHSAGQRGKIRWGCWLPDCRGGHFSPLVLKFFRGASPGIQNVRCTVLRAAMSDARQILWECYVYNYSLNGSRTVRHVMRSIYSMHMKVL